MTFSALTGTICALGDTPASSCASPSLLSTTIFLVCAESAQAQIASNEAKRRMEVFLLWEMRILSQVGHGDTKRGWRLGARYMRRIHANNFFTTFPSTSVNRKS